MIVLSAHYDHFGKDETLQGDQIYNGAVDNCSASAALLALAGYHAPSPAKRQGAEKLGPRYIPERNGELGFFYRSDQLSFARAGIPGVWLSQGIVAKGPDKGAIQAKFDDYRRTKYHKVTDEIQPDWDLRGA